MPVCYCCHEEYTRGQWTCCGPDAQTPSHVWADRWHGRSPRLEGDECGRCPRHCDCDGRTVDSPQMKALAAQVSHMIEAKEIPEAWWDK